MLDKKRAVPYDFVSTRKAKRFFQEDYMNLTRGATSKAYNDNMHDRVIEKELPDIDHDLLSLREQQRRDLSRVMGRAFYKGLQGLGVHDFSAKGRDEKRPRTPSQMEL